MLSVNFNLALARNFLSKLYVQFLSRVVQMASKETRFSNQRDLELKTTSNNFRGLLYFLKTHSFTRYQQLIELAAADNPGKLRRFSLAYVLWSLHYSANVVVKLQTNEVLPVASATSVFLSAGWLEREVWDLFGVFFEDHPDLRRILTDYGFSGHPLRKDFPLTGFFEVYYNDSNKRLSYEPVELAQEYRSFSLQSPWIQNYQKLTSKKNADVKN